MVPHHLLAADLIKEMVAEIDCDAWQEVVLVSPDHFRQTTNGQIGLTDDESAAWWQSLNLSATEKASLQVYTLGVNNEHGITAVREILRARCPQLPVHALVLNQTDAARAIWQSVAGKLADNRGTLLVISSDFSHHADLEVTRARDERSLAGLQRGDFAAVNNDCPACWDFLHGFMGEALVFEQRRNRNSYDYTGQPTNVTSYVTGWFVVKQD